MVQRTSRSHRALRQRETVINDIDREMRSHLELQVEANVRAGMSPDEARAEALRSFGNVNKAVDAAYDVKGGGLLESLTQDVRYGVRMLAKHKAFTAVMPCSRSHSASAAILAIFSVVNELLLRPLPYRDAERIVMLWEVTPEGRHQNTLHALTSVPGVRRIPATKTSPPSLINVSI